MVLSDSNAAKELYDRTDGTELLSSSNHLDLRFVPDDVIFDDEPRDECDRVPANYKPIDFTTRALNHSKVELTWDMDPEDSRRSATLKKVFTGSRADINENDLRAYLGSDSEDEDEDEGDSAAAGEGALRLGKKELARRKMREALGLSDEPTKTARLASGPVGDMQITFTPALSETAAKNKDAAEETTIEKYMRKERERKARKRGEAVANRGVDADGAEQDAEVAADMGFDDPFFASEEPVPASKSSLRKEERLKKRAAKEAEAAASAADRAKLEAILADDGRGGGGGGGGGTAAARLDHFNMRAIERAEKRKGKKKQGKGKKDCAGEGEGAALQQAFELDVEDPRFQAIFTKPEFAIDPSNPRFKATQGMKKLLDATRKKRKAEAGAEMEPAGEHRQKKGKIGKADDLGQLVHAVRKKATKM